MGREGRGGGGIAEKTCLVSLLTLCEPSFRKQALFIGGNV